MLNLDDYQIQCAQVMDNGEPFPISNGRMPWADIKEPQYDPSKHKRGELRTSPEGWFRLKYRVIRKKK